MYNCYLKFFYSWFLLVDVLINLIDWLIDCLDYHVTVILNPAASGGKGRKLFEKYSAPLLHLAGFKVCTLHAKK